MGKSGPVLGLIGIILGAGGLGFGYIIWSGQATIKTNVTDTQNNLGLRGIWYSYY